MNWIKDRIKQLESQIDDPEVLNQNKVRIKLEAYQEILSAHKVQQGISLPKDQKLVDKIMYELNDYHNMKMHADPNEEGYAIGIIEEVLRYYN